MDKEWTRFLLSKQYLTWQWTRNKQDCYPNNTLRGNGQGMNKIFVIQTIPYVAMDKEWTRLTRLSTKQYLTWQWTRNEQDCQPSNTLRGNGQGMNKIFCYPNNTLRGNGQGMNKIVIQTIPYMAMDKEWTRLLSKQYLTWQWTRNEQDCYPNNTLHGNGQGMNKINKIVNQAIPYVAMDKEWTRLLSKQYLTWQWTKNEQHCYPNNTLHGNGQGMKKIFVIQTIPYVAMDKENKIVIQTIPYVAMDKEWTRLSTKQYPTWQWTREWTGLSTKQSIYKFKKVTWLPLRVRRGRPAGVILSAGRNGSFFTWLATS